VLLDVPCSPPSQTFHCNVVVVVVVVVAVDYVVVVVVDIAMQ